MPLCTAAYPVFQRLHLLQLQVMHRVLEALAQEVGETLQAEAA